MNSRPTAWEPVSVAEASVSDWKFDGDPYSPSVPKWLEEAAEGEFGHNLASIFGSDDEAQVGPPEDE